MFKNYFKVAFRNILKYKFFSAINIVGMSIGITSCLMIILFVADELSYDKFHHNADRVYQVGLHGKLGGQDILVANTCPPLAAALSNEVPAVEASTRVAQYFGQAVVKYGDKAFTEEKVLYADSNFFDFFNFKLIEGDPLTALKNPATIVITKEIARKYFGDQSAMGKLVTIGNDNRSYTVTGVADTPPKNSHFTFNILISSISADFLQSGVWLNNFLFTYFRLRENTGVSQVNEKYIDLVEKYVGPELERFMGTSLADMKKNGGAYGFLSTKITDIHLHSTVQGDIEPGGNVSYVYLFASIGIFIVIIACINFMNLATARSAGRAKEVGLRKTLGSLRGQMVVQFLAESMMYSLLAVMLALIACYFLLPSFNLLSGKELGMSVFASPWFIGGVVSLIIFVGVISGSYPAFYLTSFQAVEVLKGKVRAGMKSKGIRSVLVVLQFTLSIGLIIFTIVIYQQLQFMHNKNLGLDKDNVLILENMDRLGSNKEPFRNALAQQTGIEKVSYTNNTFPGVNNTTVFKEAGSDQDHIMGLYYADYEHFDVMKFEMKEGRYFSRDFPSDSMAIVLNEAAAREFGYDNPVGEEILYNGDGDGSTTSRLKVIGVIKDFNFESFKSQVRPISIRLTNNSRNLMVRYQGNPQDLIQTVEKIWKEQAPNEPFEYKFLDEEFDNLFRSEQRMGQIFTVFSTLAIFIASLGLFALAAFTAEQRTKEIGIRKAMGATVGGLTVLLSKEFTWLVLIAFVLASVLAWFGVNRWLDGFAYRVSVSPFVFVISGIAAIAIAWITVSYQAIRTASTNPVKSLRYE